MDSKRLGQVQILTEKHIESVLGFERELLNKNSEMDEMEKEMSSWHAKWRQEQLEHYLSLGWSAGIYNDNNQLTAYYLAQPIVFFRGLTQTIWVEHFAFENKQDMETLLEVCYRQAREKHLQAVIIHNPSTPIAEVHEGLKTQKLDEELYLIKTAKF